MSKNKNLHDARKAKQDEFYTQFEDVEKEMNAYLEYNPDVFREKTILLPCDDPEWSNFTRFFLSRFHEYGIKKLISTSYATQSSEEEQSYGRGKILIIDGTNVNSGGVEDTEWSYLEGDGDFRSDEIKALRDEADMVITNPPFSLFREFMTWLVEGGVEFSVIGNSNAITYKEIFPPIKGNRLWLGATGNSNDMVFRVPEGVEVRDSDRDKAARLGYPSTDTEFYTRMGNSCWFSNIQHGRRHEPLPLMTMDDNLRFNNRIIKNDNSYKTYDNYDAIEIPFTSGIPSDYDGVIGVPISFLDKYSPEQFEILGCSDNGFIDELYKLPHFKKHNEPYIDGKKVYKRIFIKHKTQPNQEHNP